MLNTISRCNGFQRSDFFQKDFNKLPENKMPIYGSLDFLRKFLIIGYKAIEANYPQSIDLTAPSNNIYEEFKATFSFYTSDDFNFTLDFIPEIYNMLLNPKHPWSESMNETRAAQKSWRK